MLKSCSLCHYYFPHQDTFYCIGQATPINAWVRTLCAVLTESTERAVVGRFMAYVSKYVFQTLLCAYTCVFTYTHMYIHTVISHIHMSMHESMHGGQKLTSGVFLYIN